MKRLKGSIQEGVVEMKSWDFHEHETEHWLEERGGQL